MTTPTQAEIETLVRANWYKGKGVPIELFEAYEPHFRQYMRANNIRAIYRGPRRVTSDSKWGKTYASFTLRKDAKRVKFYHK
jgi:hypothetical protein